MNGWRPVKTKEKIKPFIFGISGLKLTEDEIELFTTNPVVGFILFNRNIDSSDQLIKLIAELRELYNYETIILVDQEGGRVQRLKPPLAPKYESAEFFSNIYDTIGRDEAYKIVKANASDIMSNLKKYGINSPCGPVADLRYTYTDNVIGDRSFGSEVHKVIELCNAFIDGVIESGGIPIIKHIPGHGRAACDSHLSLPHIKDTLDDLNKTDFEVFKQLSKNTKAKWAMTAHIVFDAIDPKYPVTLSSAAIKFIRESIGFSGIIITDDICMLALHGEIGAKYLALNNKYKEILSDLGIIEKSSLESTNNKSKNLEEELLKCQKEFIESLCQITKSCLDAGCDYVLHCSGDLDQMNAICRTI